VSFLIAVTDSGVDRAVAELHHRNVAVKASGELVIEPLLGCWLFAAPNNTGSSSP
jgi:hypothetical protein